MSEPERPAVDPEEFVRCMLYISPEDAERAREKSPATRKRGGKGQEGPTADYGKNSRGRSEDQIREILDRVAPKRGGDTNRGLFRAALHDYLKAGVPEDDAIAKAGRHAEG